MHTVKSRATRLRDLLSGDGGFTLIETLAVMVIVGLLAAITIPQIRGWREKAVLASVRNDVRIAGLAVEDNFDVSAETYPATGTIKVGDTTVFGHKLTSGNRVAYYNAENGNFQVIVESAKGSAGPSANYANYAGGPCASRASGAVVGC